MEKKRIRKEDGRYLIYYHFPESATEEQTAVFTAIRPTAEEGPEAGDSATTEGAAEKGGDHV